ncbi:MAG: LysR family transcriptional regulator [Gammaproteobacteria bacterium]|nr:LysR family transcriptional regulator [Gammaproteobacteria bacterium]MDH3449156.1 LysR family transcriptional regulator [Gammaproteobacteria bacterium]
MNLKQLRSIATIRQQGSFAAAGDRIGLSASAISVQMQQLEASLGTDLFDRSSRPVTLTAQGERIAGIAAEVLEKLELIKRVARGADTPDSMAIGFIPTSVDNLLPRVLEALREEFPQLQVRVKSGLSGELAAAVVRGELDYALLTSPVVEFPDLEITPIASEAFIAIGPARLAGIESDAALLRAMPYIAFNKRTWVGQQIAALLQQRGIHVSEAIEIDSLEAIENLVAKGFGVSIVPRRLYAPMSKAELLQVPFGDPVATRQLALVRHTARGGSVLDAAIERIFIDMPRGFGG